MEKLSEITRLLNTLAKPAQAKALESLISTPLRKKMFNLMNGKRSTKQIAGMVGTSKRNVDRFVKELHKAGLISLKKLLKGKTKCPDRL